MDHFLKNFTLTPPDVSHTFFRIGLVLMGQGELLSKRELLTFWIILFWITTVSKGLSSVLYDVLRNILEKIFINMLLWHFMTNVTQVAKWCSGEKDSSEACLLQAYEAISYIFGMECLLNSTQPSYTRSHACSFTSISKYALLYAVPICISSTRSQERERVSFHLKISICIRCQSPKYENGF